MKNRKLSYISMFVSIFAIVISTAALISHPNLDTDTISRSLTNAQEASTIKLISEDIQYTTSGYLGEFPGVWPPSKAGLEYDLQFTIDNSHWFDQGNEGVPIIGASYIKLPSGKQYTEILINPDIDIRTLSFFDVQLHQLIPFYADNWQPVAIFEQTPHRITVQLGTDVINRTDVNLATVATIMYVGVE
jgi:hypothetical protein